MKAMETGEPSKPTHPKIARNPPKLDDLEPTPSRSSEGTNPADPSIFHFRRPALWKNTFLLHKSPSCGTSFQRPSELIYRVYHFLCHLHDRWHTSS